MPVITKQSPTAQKKPSTNGAIDQLQSAWPTDDHISIMLYGRSGTGKTTLWSTFPGPILVAICSGGFKSGELRSVNTPELRKKIKPIRLTNSALMKQVIEEQTSTQRYKTVVLDHVSGLQDLTLKEILGLEELPAQKGWGLATRQQYGQSTLQCKEILRSLLGLSCNIVIIGQERTSEGDEESEIIVPTVGVAATPSLAGWLNPAVDYICQTFIRPKMVTQVNRVGGKEVKTTKRGDGVEYCIRTGPHDIFTTKFRLPKGSQLPEVIIDPNYDKILKLIQGVK